MEPIPGAQALALTGTPFPCCCLVFVYDCFFIRFAFLHPRYKNVLAFGRKPQIHTSLFARAVLLTAESCPNSREIGGVNYLSAESISAESLLY